jgi:hypothetical protein
MLPLSSIPCPSFQLSCLSAPYPAFSFSSCLLSFILPFRYRSPAIQLFTLPHLLIHSVGSSYRFPFSSSFLSALHPPLPSYRFLIQFSLFLSFVSALHPVTLTPLLKIPHPLFPAAPHPFSHLLSPQPTFQLLNLCFTIHPDFKTQIITIAGHH